MLTPHIPADSGPIDPRKVRMVRLRYWLIFIWVIMFNVMLYFGLMYLLLQSLFIASMSMAFYVGLILFLSMVLTFLARKVPISQLPECEELDSPVFRALVDQWNECCKNSRHLVPGGVYVVHPIPDTEFGELGSFMALREAHVPCTPHLLIAERMLREFSTEELEAAVFHEGGHLQSAPLSFYMLAYCLTQLVGFILVCVCVVRMKLPAHWNISVRTLYWFERVIHHVSMFAICHADEYMADAHAAESQYTAEHIVAVLFRFKLLHKQQNIDYLKNTQGRFTLEDEAHTAVHPPLSERIRRLKNLHVKKCT